VQHYRVTVNGQTYEVAVEALETTASEPTSPPAPALPPSMPPSDHANPPPHSVPASSDSSGIRAPLPGIVAEVRVHAGQTVDSGQVLVLVEAMKMANEILSPRSGRVREVSVQVGDPVTVGQVLVVLDGA